MISRRSFIIHSAGFTLAGLTAPELWGRARGAGGTTVTVYKSASCICCTQWVEHLKANGFQTVVHEQDTMDEVKDNFGVPKAMRSCHTAVVEKYLIEGHVPASDIRRLLKERPKIAGLAAPGMPAGSPGMAQPGAAIKGFQVLAFQLDGGSKVYAQY